MESPHDLLLPLITARARTDTLMTTLIHVINKKSRIIQDQNLHLEAVEESRITPASTSSYRR
ncbi:hypothetical protein A2U01_0087842, partial [Trifolium medium]|nr:hypothetical protein [Trifolium medium]